MQVLKRTHTHTPDDVWEARSLSPTARTSTWKKQGEVQGLLGTKRDMEPSHPEAFLSDTATQEFPRHIVCADLADSTHLQGLQ